MKIGEESPSMRPTTFTERRHHETTPLSRPIRILLADGQKLMRQGLCRLLEQEPDLQVVGEAETVAELCTLNHALQPDLVLLEITLAGEPDLQMIGDLLHQRPATRILILTMVDDEAVVIQALQAGAVGYLLKTMALPDLVRAIRAGVAGGTPLHPRIARAVLRHLHQPQVMPDPVEHLTARERQVLDLLAQGYSNRDIAKKLVITQFTVRSHVCRVLKKLNLANRTQAALYLLRNGASLTQ